MSGTSPVIAACLIVRNAERTIEAALASVRPYVDEIDVYDTGSTDGTLALLEDLAAQTSEGAAPIRIERGEWRDDFAWAREQAFAMASTAADWLVWLDSDDVVEGAEHLHRLAAEAADDVSGFEMLYESERDEAGVLLVQAWRERLVRRSAGLHWEGVVHELLTGAGATFRRVDPALVRWVHLHASFERWHPDRNLRLLRAEEARSREAGKPLPLRSVYYLGAELSWIGAFAEAAPYFEQYLARADPPWSGSYVHVLHRLAACLRLSGRAEDALRLELEATERQPDSAELASGLVESYLSLGRWDDVEVWAGRALGLVNGTAQLVERPLELTVLPSLRLAQARLERGDGAGAADALSELAERMPRIGELGRARTQLRASVDAGDTAAARRVVREVSAHYDLDLKAFVRGLHLGKARAELRDPPAHHLRDEVVDRLTARLRLPRPLADELRRARCDLSYLHDEYTRHVSTPEFALSLETSALVLALCRLTRPRRVLDLGSGFSSYVSRFYAAEAGQIDVVSVDDAARWLARTDEFLRSHGMPQDGLLTWEDFSGSAREPFDLVVHDLGDLLTRRQALPRALAAVAPGGLIVLDDVDRPAYGAFARQTLKRSGFELFDVSSLTLDAVNRFCWLACSGALAEAL